MGQSQTAGAIRDVMPVGTGVPGLVATRTQEDVVVDIDEVVLAVLGAAGPGASPGRPSDLVGVPEQVLPTAMSTEERQRRREAVIHDLEQARRRRRRPQGQLLAAVGLH